jgi:hypothetical protein
LVEITVGIMNVLVLSTQYKGQKLTCHWNSVTKTVKLSTSNKNFILYTGFGYLNRSKVTQLNSNTHVEVHFRKLMKAKIAIIMLKIKGVILKAQVISLVTGLKIPMSSINYNQLTR